MSKALFRKSRSKDTPYAIYQDALTGWEWRVLKAWSSVEGENKDPYARWFVAASSPFTHGGYDMGDTYVRDVTDNGMLIAATDEWIEAYPSHAKGSVEVLP
tara:strand:+ start:477 stop:779 length:303 start_codon:yes stop_codon:yes gene_type:complete